MNFLARKYFITPSLFNGTRTSSGTLHQIRALCSRGCASEQHVSYTAWSSRTRINSLLHYRQFDVNKGINVRGFRTGRRLDAWPIAALLIKLIGPLSKISKLAAMLGGRTFRTWWKRLPDHHKKKWLTHKFLTDRRTEKILLISGGVGSFCLAYYVYHLEEAPFTHRRRFMPIGNAQMHELVESEYKQVLETCGQYILPVNHPNHLRVYHVAQRLIMANKCKSTEGIKWQVNVVNTDDMNAFVLPNGQIFVFIGMLQMLPNDGALATILGHEMAHAIMRHGAEQASVHGVINLFVVVSLAILWALLPTDYIALAAQWIQERILSILLHLPYSRKLEEEADEVGMLLAAKACFDVRESPKVWKRLAVEEQQHEVPDVEWLSTHPSHSNRAENLEALLPEALEIRTRCDCPALVDTSMYPQRKGSTLLRLYGM